MLWQPPFLNEIPKLFRDKALSLLHFLIAPLLPIHLSTEKSKVNVCLLANQFSVILTVSGFFPRQVFNYLAPRR